MTTLRNRSSFRGRWGTLKSREDGTSALEFAMVAGPFFFLLFGLLEICIIFIIATVMEQSATDAARDIRTGTSTATDGAALQTEICAGMLDLFNCSNALRVQVTAVPNFDPPPTLAFAELDGTLRPQAAIPYDDGDGDDYVVVSVMLDWNLITPFISAPLASAGAPDGIRRVQATVVFQNEPF